MRRSLAVERFPAGAVSDGKHHSLGGGQGQEGPRTSSKGNPVSTPPKLGPMQIRLLVAFVVALLSVPFTGAVGHADPDHKGKPEAGTKPDHKVVVCKYVRTPGEREECCTTS